MLNHIAGYTPNACTFDILSVDPDSFSDGINVPNLMLAHNICLQCRRLQLVTLPQSFKSHASIRS